MKTPATLSDWITFFVDGRLWCAHFEKRSAGAAWWDEWLKGESVPEPEAKC
ncbi:MAG TPA: hypothetical protein VKW06_10560 [Candidatus Angelobacter sp.]|nr:hypothetical protein [Candidatus Angelobacter sp.]